MWNFELDAFIDMAKMVPVLVLCAKTTMIWACCAGRSRLLIRWIQRLMRLSHWCAIVVQLRMNWPCLRLRQSAEFCLHSSPQHEARPQRQPILDRVPMLVSLNQNRRHIVQVSICYFIFLLVFTRVTPCVSVRSLPSVYLDVTCL